MVIFHSYVSLPEGNPARQLDKSMSGSTSPKFGLKALVPTRGVREAAKEQRSYAIFVVPKDSSRSTFRYSNFILLFLKSCGIPKSPCVSICFTSKLWSSMTWMRTGGTPMTLETSTLSPYSTDSASHPLVTQQSKRPPRYPPKCSGDRRPLPRHPIHPHSSPPRQRRIEPENKEAGCEWRVMNVDECWWCWSCCWWWWLMMMMMMMMMMIWRASN